MSENSLPSVSIIIPTYNEEENIEAVIHGFLASDYPNICEILVIDGNSTDNTTTKVIEISRSYSEVKLLNNPDKIQSKALNIGLHHCRGDVFLRADAHCQYANNYIEKCIHTLLTTKAINVGGAQRFIAEEKFQAGVALAANSLLGNGGAKYRDPQHNGYVDTVFLGCMWTKDLIDIGGYSNQVTNEDAELNQRLLAKKSEAIYISSDIKVWYFPRKTWTSLWNQYFKYGRGRFITSIKYSQANQIRGKLPFLLVSCTIILFCLDLFLSGINLYTKELFFLGLIGIFSESLRVNLKFKHDFIQDIWRGKKNSLPSLFTRWLSCGIVIATLPVAHFSGYGYQLLRNKFLKVSDW